MKKIILLFVGFFVLSGCATSYQSSGLGGGYSDTKLQEGVYRVGFRGNGYTSSERAANFALLHAAEVTLRDGYNFFIVLNEKDTVKHSTFTTPVTAQTSGMVVPPPMSYGAMPMPGMYSGTTNYSGGDTYDINKPRNELLIQCFRDHPTTHTGMIYDAHQVQQNISLQYGIKANLAELSPANSSNKSRYQILSSKPSSMLPSSTIYSVQDTQTGETIGFVYAGSLNDEKIQEMFNKYHTTPVKKAV